MHKSLTFLLLTVSLFFLETNSRTIYTLFPYTTLFRSTLPSKLRLRQSKVFTIFMLFRFTLLYLFAFTISTLLYFYHFIYSLCLYFSLCKSISLYFQVTTINKLNSARCPALFRSKAFKV